MRHAVAVGGSGSVTSAVLGRVDGRRSMPRPASMCVFAPPKSVRCGDGNALPIRGLNDCRRIANVGIYE